LNLKEKFSVDLEAIPPYSFELTLRKPAGWYWSTPQENCEKNTCWSVTRFEGELLGLKLRSKGTFWKPQIQCDIYSLIKLGDSSRQAITQMLKRSLKAEEDLTGFYELSQKDDILEGVAKDLYGMHTIGWPELFPALILAVSLQMAPLKRSNQMMDLLIANFGETPISMEKLFVTGPQPKPSQTHQLKNYKKKLNWGTGQKTSNPSQHL
jgi:hypothetical protein